MAGADEAEAAWNTLADNTIRLFVVQSLIWGSVLSLITAAAFLWPESWPLARFSNAATYTLAAASLIAYGSSAVANLRFQQWRWRISPQALELKSGVLGSRHLSVPRTRILLLSFQAGPIRRRLGLYEAEIHAAGSLPEAFAIPGLSLDDVETLRSELGVS